MPNFAIYGLGNPGKEYELTRHNVGFRVLDALSKKIGESFHKEMNLKGEFSKIKLNSGTLWLGKPQTFMNNSGECISAHTKFYKIAPENVIVVYDDVTLPVATVKLSQHGGDGGHNGIKSIIQHCGNNFIRFRIGIGPKQFQDQTLADHVLGKLNLEEQKNFETKIEYFIYGLQLIINEGLAAAQNIINKK